MRDEEMIGVAAGALQSNGARRGAEVIHPVRTARALAAARPRIDEAIRADRRISRFGSRRDDGAVGFVAERHRRMHAALAHVKALAAAEIEVAVANVRVAVANAAVFEPEK